MPDTHTGWRLRIFWGLWQGDASVLATQFAERNTYLYGGRGFGTCQGARLESRNSSSLAPVPCDQLGTPRPRQQVTVDLRGHLRLFRRASRNPFLRRPVYGKSSCSVSAGGGSGIRTHVGVTQTCFQDMRLKPLGHPSRLEDFTMGRRFVMDYC